MLEDCLVESRRSGPTKKPLTVALSMGVHCCVLGVLILIPLFQLQVLPQIQSAPPLPPFRMPKNPNVRFVRLGPPGSGGHHAVLSATTLITPPVIPSRVELGGEVPEPEVFAAFRLGPGSGGRNGGDFIRGLLTGDSAAPILPPPVAPPPPEPAASQTVYKSPQRVGGDVQQANLLEHRTPVYPRLAIQTRVQGVVVLEAVITKEGNIESLRVVSGHPLLVQAALDAVGQWRYRPTLLNGEPVEVITTITVNFAFQ